MSEKKWTTIGHFIVWLLIVPPGMIFLLSTQMPEEINILYVMLFIIFGVFTVLFPIKKNGNTVTLLMWVTLPAFLMYGIAIEVIVMQLSIIATLFIPKRNRQHSERFFINSIMMFILSVVSAGAFYVVGGQIGSVDFWPILLSVIAYRVVYTTTNLGLFKGYLHLRGLKMPYSTKEIIDEYAALFLILPMALTFYFMLTIIGIGSFFLLGFPFFCTLVTIRLYGRSEKVNELIKKAGTIGTELSILTDKNLVTKQFIQKTSELFNADSVFLFKNYDEWLELEMAYEKHSFVFRNFGNIHIGEGIAGMVLESNEPVVYTKRKEWQRFTSDFAPEEIESVLCISLTHNNKKNGVLLLGSNRKNAFKDYQLKILDLLGSYYIVSHEKAGYVQEARLKSERCALTKVYNFRYLEEQLRAEIDRLQKGDIQELSVIMLDIDHFKEVNDTYGHQSGNDILVSLAQLLEEELPNSGIVGRYGGEEFVYLLPNFSKAEALVFANQIRTRVKRHPFTVIPDLSVDNQLIDVFITLSIGVSNAPYDTDEAMSLIRNADRALYIGAKQAGRDRVAEYVK